MIRAPAPPATVVVTRGDGVDAWHHVAVAVVDGDGRITHALGDPELVTFTRSVIKPLQALPLVPDRRLRHAWRSTTKSWRSPRRHTTAATCQRDIAARLLAKAGADAERLLCGAHWPIGMRLGGTPSVRGRRSRSPAPATVPENTPASSPLARTLGVAPERYLDPDSPVQRAVKRAVADACELDEASLRTGTDGCSAPNFAMPLSSLARGFKNLATRGPSGTPLDAALARVRAAMQAHPQLVSGAQRFDFEMQRAFGARVVSKGGAEGLQAIGFADPPLGIVVKVLDGGDRACAPICMAVLERARAAAGDAPPPRSRSARAPSSRTTAASKPAPSSYRAAC